MLRHGLIVQRSPPPRTMIPRRPQTGGDFLGDVDQFLKGSKLLSSVGGAVAGIGGGLVGGPIGAAAAGSLANYGIRQLGYGQRRRAPKKRKTGGGAKKRRPKRKTK